MVNIYVLIIMVCMQIIIYFILSLKEIQYSNFKQTQPEQIKITIKYKKLEN